MLSLRLSCGGGYRGKRDRIKRFGWFRGSLCRMRRSIIVHRKMRSHLKQRTFVGSPFTWTYAGWLQFMRRGRNGQPEERRGGWHAGDFCLRRNRFSRQIAPCGLRTIAEASTTPVALRCRERLGRPPSCGSSKTLGRIPTLRLLFRQAVAISHIYRLLFLSISSPPRPQNQSTARRSSQPVEW